MTENIKNTIYLIILFILWIWFCIYWIFKYKEMKDDNYKYHEYNLKEDSITIENLMNIP